MAKVLLLNYTRFRFFATASTGTTALTNKHTTLNDIIRVGRVIYDSFGRESMSGMPGRMGRLGHKDSPGRAGRVASPGGVFSLA